MNPSSKDPSSQSVKVLTESEIQQRLYGKYLRVKKKKVRPSVPPVPDVPPIPPLVMVEKALPVPENQPEWTGAEILAGELKNLRQELISLRQERELLEERLKQHAQEELPSASGEMELAGWHLIGKFLSVAVLLAAIAYPVGMRMLVASPPGIPDPSPYTVQVAVYDVKPMAQRSMGYLQTLGYPAFLMDIPRIDGKSRYRVYVGRFVTKQEAEMERATLAADPRFNDSFVRFQ